MVDQIDFSGGWGSEMRTGDGDWDGASSEIYTGARVVRGGVGHIARLNMPSTTTSYSPEWSRITLCKEM